MRNLNKHFFGRDFFSTTDSYSVSADRKTIENLTVEQLSELILKNYGSKSNITKSIADSIAAGLKAQAPTPTPKSKPEEQPMAEKNILAKYTKPYIIVESDSTVTLAERVNEAFEYDYYPSQPLLCAEGNYCQPMVKRLPDAVPVPDSSRAEFLPFLRKLYKDLAALDRDEVFEQEQLDKIIDNVIDKIGEFVK